MDSLEKLNQLSVAVQKLIDESGDDGTVVGNHTHNNKSGIEYAKPTITGKPHIVFVPYDREHRTAQSVFSEISGYWFFGKNLKA